MISGIAAPNPGTRLVDATAARVSLPPGYSSKYDTDGSANVFLYKCHMKDLGRIHASGARIYQELMVQYSWRTVLGKEEAAWKMLTVMKMIELNSEDEISVGKETVI